MMMWLVLFWVRRLIGKSQVDLHHEVLWMHKEEAERMREEVILEIVENQEESQREGGLNRLLERTKWLLVLWETRAERERLLELKEKYGK